MGFVLVTGADGFIGRRLCSVLECRGCDVRRVARAGEGEGRIAVGDIARFTGWDRLMQDVDAVVHLAARAHVPSETNATADYRAVNTTATVELAAAAARSGVRRFVFASSIGVNGDKTVGSAFTEADAPAPVGPYAASKWEAEQALQELCGTSAMEFVVVRPALVYGPGVKGNLLRLLKLVAGRVPIPLGGLRSPRSFIGLDDLCDLLVRCIEHPGAAHELFLAADPRRRSTGELLELVAAAMGRRSQIWRWPMPLLRLAATAVGKSPDLIKLDAALEVDPTKAMSALGWRARVGFADGIRETVAWFLDTVR